MNDLKEKTWFVVQGYSNYPFINEIIECYRGVKNVVWSSWDDTKPEIREKLESYGIPAIYAKPPSDPGIANLNLQKISSLNGIEFAKKQGAEFIFKARSDITVHTPDMVIKALEEGFDFKKFGVLSFVVSTDPQQITDLMTFSDVDRSALFWSVNDIHGFAERILAKEYLLKSGLEYITSYEYMRKHFFFMMEIFYKHNIKMNWLKRNEHFDWLFNQTAEAKSGKVHFLWRN